MLRSVRLILDLPSASNPSVRCGRPSGPEAEQRLKRGRRLPTPIVPKDELVQVDLKHTRRWYRPTLATSAHP